MFFTLNVSNDKLVRGLFLQCIDMGVFRLDGSTVFSAEESDFDQ
jgi:hypothetical protein